jgi:Flp pilus assembly protein TadG
MFRGQAMAEFALVASMFFFLIFAVLDFGRMFLIQANLQDAIDQAGRFASTGNHLNDPRNPGQTLSRINSIIQTFQNAAYKWPGVDLSGLQISSQAGGAGSAGGPGDTVTLSLTTNLKLMTPLVSRFFPNGTYTFTSTASFKNEPFSADNTK